MLASDPVASRVDARRASVRRRVASCRGYPGCAYATHRRRARSAARSSFFSADIRRPPGRAACRRSAARACSACGRSWRRAASVSARIFAVASSIAFCASARALSVTSFSCAAASARTLRPSSLARSRAARELLLVVGELGVGLGSHPLGFGAGTFDARPCAARAAQVRLEQQLVGDSEQEQEQPELNKDRQIDVDQRVGCGEDRESPDAWQPIEKSGPWGGCL